MTKIRCLFFSIFPAQVQCILSEVDESLVVFYKVCVNSSQDQEHHIKTIIQNRSSQQTSAGLELTIAFDLMLMFVVRPAESQAL